MAVIPFYGAEDPDLFAVERRAMDRRGRVLAHLDAILPPGLVLDVGAGDGFTAERLSGPDRRVVALEPAHGMVRPDRPLGWVRGDAEHLPFSDHVFDAAYATWAYFFPGHLDVGRGLDEASRVVRPGGLFAVVDNVGGDEFTALADRPIVADVAHWEREGFDIDVIETAFEFDSIDEARLLLGHFFGDAGSAWSSTVISFRVGVFTRRW